MHGDQVDFFVSHAGVDRAWAEWVAWQLMDAGYSVELDIWDWPAGRNFVTAMSDALERADRVVVLFSAAYFERERYTTMEWSSPLVRLPGIEQERLVPVQVEGVPAEKVPAVLRPLMVCDVFGLDEDTARRALLTAVSGSARPGDKPRFPGRSDRPDWPGPRRPGSRPQVWNVPARNPGFTGRDGMLVTIRERLLADDRTVVQALHGMGGVGKTQLAAEYAHRFAGGYDLVWWIAAEQAGLIGEQFAVLAGELGCTQPGAELAAMRRAVLAELRRRDRWLLVFDNAENPDDLAGWLPGGSGHVLITSRTHRWTEIAAPVEVDVLSRSESVAILRERVPALTAAAADTVAAALGDLPLAVVQAAGYMVDTGMSGTEYTGLLDARAAEILDQGRPVSYPLSLAAVSQLAFDRLRAENPAAAEVVGVCAFLAPEPVPADWFTHAAAQLPAPLDGVAADPMAWRQVLARIGRDALARIDHHGLQMHRLTQAILRSHLSSGDAVTTRARAEALLVANHPESGQDPGSWPVWARLLPHLLALDLATSRNSGLRGLAGDAAWYLVKRGDARRGRDLAGHLYRQWRDRLGPDDKSTLRAATSFAYALHETGDFRKALELDEDTLARRRRVLGEDDRATLSSAINLALHLRALGEIQAARELDEDTLVRWRRVQGEDHLGAANNLAIDLRVLGEIEAARRLEEDVLARRRRVLGEDHPDTLISASNLAAALRELGDAKAARELSEDTLARRRRVLGEEHPSTLRSACNLAGILRAFGEMQAARELEEDTLIRRREVLGEDHPDTLVSASNLVSDLRALGEPESARQLEEDTRVRYRRVFGDDCPDLFSASYLAAALHALAEI